MAKCSVCNGTGRIERRSGPAAYQVTHLRCVECHGTGSAKEKEPPPVALLTGGPHNRQTVELAFAGAYIDAMADPAGRYHIDYAQGHPLVARWTPR